MTASLILKSAEMLSHLCKQVNAFHSTLFHMLYRIINTPELTEVTGVKLEGIACLKIYFSLSVTKSLNPMCVTRWRVSFACALDCVFSP